VALTAPHVPELGGVAFEDLGFDATVERIVTWARDGSGGYVCTPNVDYIIRAARDPSFSDAIAHARLRVPDGMGVIYGSWIAGRRLRRSVTGRLLPAGVVARLPGEPLPIALFGAGPGVAEAAAARLRASGGQVVDAFGPPVPFEIGSAADAEAVARIQRSGARVVFVSLGAPKQELWMERHGADLSAVLVGVGAALDVISGRSPEAPAWMTRIGLEWAYRLAHQPRRLARRYLLDDPRFFWWMVRERLGRPVNARR
jgi:N-acetylglucosaminyldiphosphoundecaprenol N-acetyl-beta-D-mannosaminyltransferase